MWGSKEKSRRAARIPPVAHKVTMRNNMQDAEVVQQIKKLLIAELKKQFGYCGVAENESSMVLNSGNKNIVISIRWE